MIITRGSPDTKLHVVVANSTTPIKFFLSRGVLNDGPQGGKLVENLDETYGGSYLLMDKAYEGNQTRKTAVERSLIPVVPPKANRREP